MQIMISLRASDFTFSLFARIFIRILCYGLVTFKKASIPISSIALRTYPGSVRFLPDHSGEISVSCVYYGFLYFIHFPLLITVVLIFYLLVIFPRQTHIRVNIRAVRCLKYSASLVPTHLALRRNSDNIV